MKRTKEILTAVLALLITAPLASAQRAATSPENIRLPDGFEIELLYSVPRDTQGSWKDEPTDVEYIYRSGAVNTLGVLVDAAIDDIERVRSLSGSADTRQPFIFNELRRLEYDGFIGMEHFTKTSFTSAFNQVKRLAGVE